MIVRGADERRIGGLPAAGFDLGPFLEPPGSERLDLGAALGVVVDVVRVVVGQGGEEGRVGGGGALGAVRPAVAAAMADGKVRGLATDGFAEREGPHGWPGSSHSAIVSVICDLRNTWRNGGIASPAK